MQKVLLIDDNWGFHWLWKRGITDRFCFLQALTIVQAQEHFRGHSDIAAIVVDACMQGKRGISIHVPIRQWGFNTRELIHELRDEFRGPIIASPSQWWHFKPMLEAGCTHYAWKWRVGPLLKKLLL